MFIGIWLALAFLVAFVGKNKKVGFWNTFIISALLSPLAGLIIALVSKHKNHEYARKCNQCGFIVHAGNQFCASCDKDHYGLSKEDYQALSNDLEYQKQVQEERIREELQFKKQNSVKIGLAILATVIPLLVYFFLDNKVF